MNNMGEMYEMTNAYNELLQMLYDSEIEEQTVLDTLDSIEDALEVKADCLSSMIGGLQSDIDGIDGEIKRLQARKRTFENRRDSLKSYIFAMMRATGKKKFKTMLYSYGIRKAGTRSLELTVDVDELPQEYKKIVVTADKDAIKKMMKEQGTEETPYARLLPATEFLSIQ